MDGEYSFFPVEGKSVPFRAVRCRTCGFAITDPAPTASYEGNQIVEDDEHLVNSGRYRIRRLRKYLSRETRMLELGCSTGYGLDEAKRYGVLAPIGVELCQASALAGRQLGRDIRSGPLDECAFSEASFDIVQAHHTLEHIQTLKETIAEIQRILKPGGLFYITQPTYDSPFVRDSNWKGWFPQEHYWHFTKRTLASLLSQQGFNLLTYNCPLHTEYATARNWLYPAKRIFKAAVKYARLGDMVDAIFVRR
jgi:SAM-dependent methyltransferase